MSEKNNENLKKNIKAELMKRKDKIPSESLPAIEDVMYKVLGENKSIREALNISQDLVDAFYKNGYFLFKSGKFKETLGIFEFLRIFDASDPRYTLALAVTHHHMKNYEEAIGNYLLYGTVDPENPMPYYHMYDCFKKMGNKDLATLSLEIAYKNAGNNPEYAALKSKLNVELATVNQI